MQQVSTDAPVLGALRGPTRFVHVRGVTSLVVALSRRRGVCLLVAGRLCFGCRPRLCCEVETGSPLRGVCCSRCAVHDGRRS